MKAEISQNTPNAILSTEYGPPKWMQWVLGLVFGTALFSQTFSFFSKWFWQVFLLIGLCAFGIIAAGWLLRKCLLPGLSNLQPKQRIPWLLICGLLGYLLIFLIPITVNPMPQVIEIYAKGDKNTLSKGSEVWLQSITAGDYDSPAFMKSCQGDWIKTGALLVSYSEQQPSRLICTVRSDDSFTVRLGTHPWSGKMELIYGRIRTVEDLYSAESGFVELTFEVQPSFLQNIIWWIFFFTIGMTIGLLLAAITLLLTQKPAEPIQSRQSGKIPWFIYGGIIISAWLFFLLVFWPGFFSSDIFNQFHQIETGQYDDWHPIFHTLFLWLTTRISFTPTPAVVVQIISLGLLLGWGLSMLERLGSPNWLNLGSAFYLAISPAIGLTILNPWKDLAYSISIAALALVLFYWSIKPRSFRMKYKEVLILTAISLCVSLFRHNGPVVAFTSMLYFMLVDRLRWKSYLSVLVATFLIWGLVRGPIYQLLPQGSNSARESGENIVPLSEAVYLSRLHLRSGTSISAEEEQLLSELVSIQGKMDIALLRQNSEQIIDLALRATLEQPAVTLRYFIQKGSFVYQILRPPNARFGYVGMGFVENPYGIELDSKIPQLVDNITRFKALTVRADIDWFVWRNAFWMYILLLGGLSTSIRFKNWAFFSPALLVLLNALPYSIVASPQGRYILPSIILGPLFGLCLLFVRRSSLEQGKNEV